MADVFEALEATGLATYVRESVWAFPVVESLHIIGLALLLGAISVLDLRLLGWSRHLKVSLLARHCLPIARLGFATAVVTGLLMFAAHASTLATNWCFQVKLLCIAAAGVNMACFHLGVFRRVAGWDEQVAPPWAARLAGGASLLIWMAVIAFGRLIAFV